MQNKVTPGTSDTGSTLASPAKRVYQTPKLTTFGEVRLLTGGGQGSGSDGGTMAGMTRAMHMYMSDLRCKEALIRIGTHPQGFGLYLFSYKAGFDPVCAPGTRHFGVMAQEVADIVPAAVSTADNGYLQVDYGMLGVYPERH